MPSIKERITALEKKKKSERDSEECRTTDVTGCGPCTTSSSQRPLSAPAISSSISEKIKALTAGGKNNSTSFSEAPSKAYPASPKSNPEAAAAFRTSSSTRSQISDNKDFLSSPGSMELSVSGTLSEANQKKEIGEPADTRIVKSGSEVLDEEKEQLKEISATEEEIHLMDGITGLSESMRKMVNVVNSEPPPQVEDDEGVSVVANAPPSQRIAQASSSLRLDSSSGRIGSGIAARAAKLKSAFTPPEPTRKQILHCNSPPRNISITSGRSDDVKPAQQSRPLSISDRIKMEGVGMPLPAFGGGSYFPANGAMSSSAATTVMDVNENTGPGNNMSHCQLDRPVQPRKRPPRKKAAFKPVSTLDTI